MRSFRIRGIAVSELIRVEFFSAIHRRFRNHEIDEAELNRLTSIFDASLHRYRVTALSVEILAEAEFLLRTEGRRFLLRTLDSLHLATFRVVGDPAWTFVSTDDQSVNIAQALGHPVLDPLV